MGEREEGAADGGNHEELRPHDLDPGARNSTPWARLTKWVVGVSAPDRICSGNSTTKLKGSDNLRALFLARNPRARGVRATCAAGGQQPKRPKSGTFSARGVSILCMACG